MVEKVFHQKSIPLLVEMVKECQSGTFLGTLPVSLCKYLVSDREHLDRFLLSIGWSSYAPLQGDIPDALVQEANERDLLVIKSGDAGNTVSIVYPKYGLVRDGVVKEDLERELNFLYDRFGRSPLYTPERLPGLIDLRRVFEDRRCNSLVDPRPFYERTIIMTLALDEVGDTCRTEWVNLDQDVLPKCYLETARDQKCLLVVVYPNTDVLFIDPVSGSMRSCNFNDVLKVCDTLRR